MPDANVMKPENQRILKMPKLPKDAFMLPIKADEPAFNQKWEGWKKTESGQLALEIELSGYGKTGAMESYLLCFGQDFLNVNKSREYRLLGPTNVPDAFEFLTSPATEPSGMITIEPHIGQYDAPPMIPGKPNRYDGRPEFENFFVVVDGHHRLFWAAYHCPGDSFELEVGCLQDFFMSQGQTPRNSCTVELSLIRPFEGVKWYINDFLEQKESEELKKKEAKLKSFQLVNDSDNLSDDLYDRVELLEQKVAYLETKPRSNGRVYRNNTGYERGNSSYYC